MNIVEEHKKMVGSLAKPGDKILESLDAQKTHLLHMIVGVTDEYFELQVAIANQDHRNILEELGDLAFYTVGIGLNYDLPIPQGLEVWPPARMMRELHRLAKKHVFYDQPLNQELKLLLLTIYQNLLSYIERTGLVYGLSIDNILHENMNKLGVRYKNFKYSDQRAIQREDKQ